MTEAEAKQALFNIHFEYMQHNSKEREKLYADYIKKRGEIKSELARIMKEKREKEIKIK